MPALISHLVMPQEAAASFPLERATVFLLDTDRWGFGQELEASDFLPFIHSLIPYTARLS